MVRLQDYMFTRLHVYKITGGNTMTAVGNIEVRVLPTYQQNISMAMAGRLSDLTSLKINKNRFTVLLSPAYDKEPIFDEIQSVYYFFDGTEWHAFMDEGLTIPVPAELIGHLSLTEDPSVPGLHPDFIAQKTINFSGGKLNFYFEFGREFIYPGSIGGVTPISGILLYAEDQGRAINLNLYPFAKKDTDTFILDAKLEI